MERIWVKDLQAGQQVAGVFEVARKQLATGKNGRVFLKLTLQDKTGQLDARVWNDAAEVATRFEAGDRIEVEGQVVSFQRAPQLTIEKLEKSTAIHDPADFAYEPPPRPTEERKGAGGAEGQYQALRAELARVSDPHVRALLLAFLDDPEFVSKLRRAPASREVHHAYAGGLLEHLLSCVRLAGWLADHYPMVDRDLLLAGAFLRDLDTIARLGPDRSQTDEGLLVGPGVIGAGWIRDRVRTLTDFPKELELHLLHLVLGGRGEQPAASVEAFLVHHLVELDGQLFAMLAQMARSAGGGRWTQPQRAGEVRLWKAAAPTEEGRRRGPPAKGLGKKRRKEVEVEVVERPRRERAPRAEEGRQAAPEAAAPTTAAAPAAPQREEGERRGPKILKPARQGARAPAAPKLTFKPFSAFTGEEEEAKAQEEAPQGGPTPAAGFPEEQGAPSSGPEDSLAAEAPGGEVPAEGEAAEAPQAATEAAADAEAAASGAPEQPSSATAPEMKPPAEQAEAAHAAAPSPIGAAPSGSGAEGGAAPPKEPAEPKPIPPLPSEPIAEPAPPADERSEGAPAEKSGETGLSEKATAAVEGTPPEGRSEDPS